MISDTAPWSFTLYTMILICILAEILIQTVKQKNKKIFNKKNSFIIQNESFNLFLNPKEVCEKKHWFPLKNLGEKNFCVKTCGADYINFHNKDNILAEGIALPSSTVCVPNTVLNCNFANQYAFLTTKKGIKCIPKELSVLPENNYSSTNLCKSNECSESENQLNVLWDNLTNVPAVNTSFETNTFLPGTLRKQYSCMCNGKTYNGKYLSSSEIVPYHCYVDKCKTETFSDSYLDVGANKCICSQRTFNKYPFDLSSPCTDCAWRSLDNANEYVQGIIDCHTETQSAEKINLIPCGSLHVSNSDYNCQKATLKITFY